MSKLKVLVVGASVAGPTAAYWLAKAGAHVTVVERFPRLRTNGQNIDIRTTGVTVMRKMPGMETAVRAKIAPLEGFAIVREDGRPYATIKASGDPDQQSPVSEYEILRGDLAQILFDLTKDRGNIKYVFGEQVTCMHQHDDGPVKVSFANGLPASEYDLVVACDGATSRTRAMGLGCGVRDHVNPQNCWAAYFTIQQDILNGSKIGQSWTSIPGRFLGVGPGPYGGNKVIVMGINPSNNGDATLPFREAAKKGDDALKGYIAKRHEGAGWKTDEIMESMMESDDFYASEIVQVKVPSLYKGRFTLVGDAGYAPGFTGTGTSLAITGAYILAGELGQHKGDIQAGLRGYEERMRPIIDAMQKVPPGLPGILAPQTAWGLQLRNTVVTAAGWGMAFSPYFAWAGKLFAGLFSSAFSTDKYGIPKYEWVD